MTQKVKLLELSPERIDALNNVALKIADLLMAETKNPLEGLLVLKKVTEGINNSTGITLDRVEQFDMSDGHDA